MLQLLAAERLRTWKYQPIRANMTLSKATGYACAHAAAFTLYGDLSPMEGQPATAIKRTQLHGVRVYAREGLDLADVAEGLRYVTNVSSTAREIMRQSHLGLYINMANDLGVATIFRRDAAPEMDEAPSARVATMTILELVKNGRAFMAIGEKKSKPLLSAVVALLPLFARGLSLRLR